jgi:proteasome lid subunit RPN8/RPN11
MFAKVRVRKGALNYFRKLARQAAPLEIQAYLAGRVRSIDEVEITDFLYTKEYATQTSNEVAWFREDYNKLKEKIEAEGKTIIGDIHSHPDCEALMSDADFKASVIDQFVICGICSVINNKTIVRFWTPTSALPCEKIYT